MYIFKIADGVYGAPIEQHCSAWWCNLFLEGRLLVQYDVVAPEHDPHSEQQQ